MDSDTPELAHVLRLIDRVRREWITAGILGGAAAFVALLLGLCIVAVAAEMLFAPPPFLRWTFLVLLILAALIGGGLFVVKRLLHEPQDEEVALIIESCRPDLHNELINAVRLSDDADGDQGSYVGAAIRESDRRASMIESKGIVSWRAPRRAAVIAAALGLAWIGLAVAAPVRVGNALKRVLLPHANMEKIGRTRIIEVVPGDATVVAGADVVIRATFDSTPRAEAEPRVEHAASDAPLRSELLLPIDGNTFGCTLHKIKAPRRYRVIAGSSRTRDYTISVTEPPLVTRIAARILWPEYTGKEATAIEETRGRVEALSGSRAALTFHTSKRVRSARLTLNETDIPLAVATNGLSAETRQPILLKEDLTGEVVVADREQCRSDRSVRLVVTPDTAPQVKIAAPGRDTAVSPGGALDLAVRATDDYGIVRAELCVLAGEDEAPQVRQVWERFSDPRNVAINWSWAFPESEFHDGDTVRYFVRMLDGNSVSGPGVGTSSAFSVRIEDAELRRAKHEEALREWHRELSEILARQRELRRESGRLIPEDTQEIKESQ